MISCELTNKIVDRTQSISMAVLISRVDFRLKTDNCVMNIYFISG